MFLFRRYKFSRSGKITMKLTAHGRKNHEHVPEQISFAAFRGRVPVGRAKQMAFLRTVGAKEILKVGEPLLERIPVLGAFWSETIT